MWGITTTRIAGGFLDVLTFQPFASSARCTPSTSRTRIASTFITGGIASFRPACSALAAIIFVFRMHFATNFRYPSRPKNRVAAYAAATPALFRVPRRDVWDTLGQQG